MKLWFPLIAITACVAAGPVSAQDAFEDDDTPETSHFIGVNDETELHDFHDAGDVDWVRFLAEDGHPIRISTENLELSPEGDTYLELYHESDLVNPIDINDDIGGGDLSSTILITDPETAVYYLKVMYSPEGTGTGFGPDTHYDLIVITEEAECIVGVKTKLTGTVTGAGVGSISAGEVVAVRMDTTAIETYTILFSAGEYFTTKLTGSADAPGYPYRLRITASGFPMQVVDASVISCITNTANVALNKNSQANTAVNFTRTLNDLQDGASAGSAYRTLEQGILAVAPGSNVNLAPATSAETFAGGSSITKAMTLTNSNPSGGVVRIGDSGARSLERVESAVAPRTGFVSRGTK